MFMNVRDVAEGLFDSCRRARSVNRANLRKILTDNRNTEYGLRHDFVHIPTEDEYRARLPLTDYSAYGEDLCRPNAYTAYPVYVLLASSGTTGTQKHIPLTTEALLRYSSYSLDMARYATGAEGKVIHTNVFRSPVNGVGILSNTHLNWLRESGTYDFSNYVGGEECHFSDQIRDTFYVKSRLMLSTPDLSGIVSIFLYDLAMLFSYLETNWRSILSDIRQNTVSVPMPEKVIAKLLSLRPSDEWLDELEGILSQGFETPIMPRIWKDLKYVIGIAGKMYRFQERALGRYLGDIPVHYSIYASSECMMAVAPDVTHSMSAAEYVMIPDCAYYEYLTREDSRPVTLDELEVGGEYEPVVTTFSGLYRYRTGDIVRVTSFIGESPVFEVIGRRQLVINIAGEKVDVWTATEAVDRWAKKLGVTLYDFALGIDTSIMPQGYILFTETDRVPEDLCAEAFDDALCELSVDYRELRELGMISPPQICPVRRGEIFASISAAAKAAHKKPRVFIGAEASEYLRERRIDRGQ